MIETFFNNNESFTYEVDENSAQPIITVRHSVYGERVTQLGGSPAATIANMLADELRIEYQNKKRVGMVSSKW